MKDFEKTMVTTTEIITPEKAGEILKYNTRNRPLKHATVARFVRDIANDKWKLTHQGIGIAPTFVVDGQHRLQAIRESGQACLVNVTRYLTDEAGEEALMAVDITNKRSIGDMLEIGRCVNKGEGKILAALARSLGMLGLTEHGDGTKQLTVAEVQQVIESQKEHFAWCLDTFVDEDEKGGLRRGVTGARSRFSLALRTAFVVAHILDPVRVTSFADAYVKGDARLYITDGPASDKLMPAWMRAADAMKFRGNFIPTVYFPLRLLRCVITGEAPPQKIIPTRSVVDWFRTQLKRKHAQEAGLPVEKLEIFDEERLSE